MDEVLIKEVMHHLCVFRGERSSEKLMQGASIPAVERGVSVSAEDAERSASEWDPRCSLQSIIKALEWQENNWFIVVLCCCVGAILRRPSNAAIVCRRTGLRFSTASNFRQVQNAERRASDGGRSSGWRQARLRCRDARRSGLSARPVGGEIGAKLRRLPESSITCPVCQCAYEPICPGLGPRDSSEGTSVTPRKMSSSLRMSGPNVTDSLSARDIRSNGTSQIKAYP